jgi:hypothetical protein
MSKRYTVAHVRERLSDALDEAERGMPVYIERRGKRFRLSLATGKPHRRAARKPRIEVLDSAVAAGLWSWDVTAKGLKFRSRGR